MSCGANDRIFGASGYRPIKDAMIVASLVDISIRLCKTLTVNGIIIRNWYCFTRFYCVYWSRVDLKRLMIVIVQVKEASKLSKAKLGKRLLNGQLSTIMTVKWTTNQCNEHEIMNGWHPLSKFRIQHLQTSSKMSIFILIIKVNSSIFFFKVLSILHWLQDEGLMCISDFFIICTIVWCKFHSVFII